MNSQKYNDVVIFSLKYTQVAKAADDTYLWGQRSEVDNKRDDKLFNIIKTALNGELSKNHKDYISYHIDSILDGEHKRIEQRLNIRYMSDSDFDVSSIIEEAKRIVKNTFSSVDKAVKVTGGEAHRAKIVLSSHVGLRKAESEQIVVSSDLEKSLVEKIILGVSVRSNDDFIYKVNISGDEVDMTLAKTDNVSVISDRIKFEFVNVICVDDKRRRVKVLVEHEYKQKEYYFDEDLRNELLESQLHRNIIKIEIIPNEKLLFGEWHDDGGSIIGLNKIEEKKLI
jgi:hypothetical protein